MNSPIIPLSHLQSLAVWFAAGYRYQLVWDQRQWRFTFLGRVQ